MIHARFLRRVDLLCRCGQKFGRNVSVAGRGDEQILGKVGFGFTQRPADTAGEEIEEESVLPIFRAIAHGDEEDAAFAVHASPGDGIRTALVALVLEDVRVYPTHHTHVSAASPGRTPFSG